jgi:hypothetical protein
LSIVGKTLPHDYPALIKVLNIYATLLVKTDRKAQAELVETRAMTYQAEFREMNSRR